MEEIDLKELGYSFWKNKVLIIILAIVGMALGIVYQKFLVTPMYKSTTSLVLAQGNGSNSDIEKIDGTNTNNNDITLNDITLNQKLVSTYGEIIKSRTVAKDVIEKLNLSMSEDQFIANITVNSKKDTELLEITVQNEDSKAAVEIVNALADAFIKKVADVYNINNVSVIDVGEQDSTPFNIDLLKTSAISTFAGIMIAVLIIFIKFYFNNTISNEEDIEKGLGLPVLAVIPKYNEK